MRANKATLLHKLESPGCLMSEDITRLPGTVHVIDGNSLLHALVGVPSTLGELADTVFSSLPQASSIHFITDTYKHNSIKNSERLRRGSSDVNSCVLRGPATKVTNWKLFLSNDENKTSLINFLQNEWEKDHYSSKLENKEVYFVNEERCVVITRENDGTTNSRPVPDLFSSHEEADTRIIFHCVYASKQTNTRRIVVRSQDTDVFLLLLSFW